MIANFCPEISLEKGFSGCEAICSNDGEDSLSQLKLRREGLEKSIDTYHTQYANLAQGNWVQKSAWLCSFVL